MARSRHKGARPVDMSQFYRPYDDTHPVARAIATGSNWFSAWQFQHAFNNARLARVTGLDPARIDAIRYGDDIRRSEVARLAAAYGVQPSDIIASLPDKALLVEE